MRNNLDKKTTDHVENMLYQYFGNKKRIQKMDRKINFLNNQIELIEHKIKTTDVSINDYYIPGYMGEKVQTSVKTSGYAENKMINIIDDLEKKVTEMKKNLIKTKLKKQEVEWSISSIEDAVNSLNEKEKKFVDYKYRKNIRVAEISRVMHDDFHVEQDAFYTLRDKILEKIYNEINY